MLDLSHAPALSSATIVPDIHCRDYWQSQVSASRDAREAEAFIFLGDYLDPHSSDLKGTYGPWIGHFFDVLPAMQSSNKNVMLVGNHDLGYLLNFENCSRMAPKPYFKMFSKVFQDHADLFSMTATRKIGEKIYFFSHAGVTRSWLEKIAEMLGLTFSEMKEKVLKGYFNRLLKKAFSNDPKCNAQEAREILMYFCSMCAPCRGGDSCGSLLWADESEWRPGENAFEEEGIIQVFGHNRLTRSNPELIKDCFCYDFYQPRIEVIK